MIIQTAVEVVKYAKQRGVERCFSLEESFLSDLVDLLTFRMAISEAGVYRADIADTV